MSSKYVSMILVLATCAGLPAVGRADLPPDQSVQFKIRKTPSDPNSPITWTITAEIHALAQVGDDFKWEVSGVEIRRLGPTPALDQVWYEALPAIDTADGYWWVSYVSYESDFRQLPPIAGLAINDDPAGNDLYYDFVGETPGSGPDDGYLTYVLQKEGEPEPEEEGDDESGDVPTGVRDPLQSAQ